MHGGMGRRFGGVGLALAEPRLSLQAARYEDFELTGEGGDKAQSIIQHLSKQLNNGTGARIHIEQTIAEHQGLGSGTQMALALGKTLAELYGLDWSNADIACFTERGNRSGIGIGAFERGGFLVDGGKGATAGIPPITVRLPVPDAWRVVLIGDSDGDVGLHGQSERRAFDALPEFSASCAGYLSRLVMLTMLPALVEGDFNTFAGAITKLQNRVGEYFASVQNGSYASPRIRAVLEYLHSRGVQGVGQTSWGPTGFALAPDAETAAAMTEDIKKEFFQSFAVRLSVTQIDNEGARISRVAD